MQHAAGLLALGDETHALIVMQLATDTKDFKGDRIIEAFLDDFRAVRQLCHAARHFGGDGVQPPAAVERATQHVEEYGGPLVGLDDVLIWPGVIPPFDWHLMAYEYKEYQGAYERRFPTYAMEDHLRRRFPWGSLAQPGVPQ